MFGLIGKLFGWLKGKKTYTTGTLMVILTGLKAQGYIDDATYETIMGILLGAGVITLRAGQNK
jgi:hypothetical protein